MKKKILCGFLAFSTLMGSMALVACGSGIGGTVKPDYNADIQVIAPENINIEHFVTDEGETYYTSPGLYLCMEVNGAYLTMDYFSIDGNKRVYDNLYFYEDDYFYMITGDYRDIYASLGNSTDTEYAEEEKEQGYDIQVNVKKSGIYKLVFDLDTLKFDMEYKAEIETPVYYTIKKCQIYSVASGYVEMSVNLDNEDEFVVRNFHIDAGKYIYFHDYTHVSMYKISVDESCNNKYGSYTYPNLAVGIGGDYNVYINAKTYVVRLELLNPDTATYSCVYYDGTDFIELQPYNAEVPYIFRRQITVDKYDDLPDFHTANYKTYDLTVVDTADVLMGSGTNYYFKQAGTYDVVINLKTFEITAELLPQ